MTAAVAWILSLLVLALPPDRVQAMPGREETLAAREARYLSIATDVAAVVYAPASPVLYAGSRARAHTAALIIAVAVLESGLAADVDAGPCYRGRDGRSMRCDSGRAHGLWQVHDPNVQGDRRAAARAALRILRGSFAASTGERDHAWSAEERLSHRLDLYAGGRSRAAHLLGMARLALADRLAARPGAPTDAAVLASVTGAPAAAAVAP